jgi:hypothetical protein
MKNLYKASFSTVIYAEDNYEAVEIARDLAHEDTSFCFTEETLEEILSEDDLPCGWEVGYHPIKCADGNFEDKKIREILEENKTTFVLRQRIKELETELSSLKKNLDNQYGQD